jgi:cell division septation protein DedD
VAEEDNSTEPLEEEESGDPEKNDDQKEEDIEQVEQEKPKEKTKGKRILKFRDMTNKGDWKKIGFGKSFWIILSLFVIIAIIGIYIFLFDDSDSSHEIVAEDSTKVVQEKTEGVKDSAIAAFLEDDKNATVDTTNKEATDNNQHIEEESTPQLKTEQEQPDKTLDITPEIRVITNEKRINGNIYFDGNKYMLQVASFKSKSRAERHARSLRQQGHNAFIVEADLPQLGGTWYRVRIGDFNSQQAAQNYLIEHKF